MYHTIIIAGNVGKEPEMRYIPSGQAVTSFSLASSRGYTNSSGQQVKETIWFRISAWGKMAETVQNYVHKGSKVLVEGRLTADEKGNPRTFTRQDGTTGASFEVTASTVRFIGSRTEGESAGGEESGETTTTDGEEIPF